ncbi:MAG TPA: ABC transporter substrate-binding protein, partial [Opitutaceae bacterium]
MLSLRKFIFTATAALLVASLRADVKVGEVASLTGKEAAFGQSSHKGTVLAIEELNAAGGVFGEKIDLITEDNESKSGESVTAAKKLIARDKVIAL